MDRRTFLKAATAVAAVTALPARMIAGTPQRTRTANDSEDLQLPSSELARLTRVARAELEKHWHKVEPRVGKIVEGQLRITYDKRTHCQLVVLDVNTDTGAQADCWCVVPANQPNDSYARLTARCAVRQFQTRRKCPAGSQTVE